MKQAIRLGVLLLVLVTLACGGSSGESSGADSRERASCRDWWNDHAPDSIRRSLTSHGFTRSLYGPSVSVTSTGGGSANTRSGCLYSFYTADLRHIEVVEGIHSNSTMVFRNSAARPVSGPDKFELQQAHPLSLARGARIPRTG